MSDKLCHCASHVVTTLMEEDEPLEYAEDVLHVVSSAGAHSSRESSKYFHWGRGKGVLIQGAH